MSSLSRPGGNITGVTFFINTLGAKRLELLRELVPSATVIGFLVNPGNPTSEPQITDVRAEKRSAWTYRLPCSTAPTNTMRRG